MRTSLSTEIKDNLRKKIKNDQLVSKSLTSVRKARACPYKNECLADVQGAKRFQIGA